MRDLLGRAAEGCELCSQPLTSMATHMVGEEGLAGAGTARVCIGPFLERRLRRRQALTEPRKT